MIHFNWIWPIALVLPSLRKSIFFIKHFQYHANTLFQLNLIKWNTFYYHCYFVIQLHTLDTKGGGAECGECPSLATLVRGRQKTHKRISH